MIESGGYRRFDKLIVVHCRPEVQLQRLIDREGMSPEDASLRIAAQMTQEAKKKYADFLIDTPRDHGLAGLVHMFGIESPGLTASLSLGEEVAGYLSS